MRLGLEHERRHLDALSRPHRPRRAADRRARRAHPRGGRRRRARRSTRARFAPRPRSPAREVEIVGVPDFLLPARRGYAIRDSKLARRIGGRTRRSSSSSQLYGWLYEQTFGEPPVALQVHAGDGEILDLPYEGGERRARGARARSSALRLADEEPHELGRLGRSARAAASSSAAGRRRSSAARSACCRGSTAA